MDKNWERLGRLTPEEKLRLCMDMSDGCIRVCADGIRCQFPGVKEEELIDKLRERLQWPKLNR